MTDELLELMHGKLNGGSFKERHNIMPRDALACYG